MAEDRRRFQLISERPCEETLRDEQRIRLSEMYNDHDR